MPKSCEFSKIVFDFQLHIFKTISSTNKQTFWGVGAESVSYSLYVYYFNDVLFNFESTLRKKEEKSVTNERRDGRTNERSDIVNS